MDHGRHTYLTFRNILIYVVLLWSGMTVNAQSGKGSFAGRVVDKDTKQPVGYAAVRLLTLPDSTFLAGVATTDDGKFRIPVVWPKDKKLLLEISFIGYTTFSKSIPSSFRGTLQNLGDIALFSDGILLGETVVVGKAPLAVTEQDTTVFNASAYRTPEGSMLEDLVKQLPGGEIDGDGKLLIHGNEVKKILVDGKEFFANDPKAALKNLPVEMVEKLRAYERKSDLARLTGIDDGDEEMILDLGVKKDMKKGWMDNFMAGTGNKGRYELANTLNRFRDNSQLTIIGNLNNTNNQGFSELQRESSAASGNILNRQQHLCHQNGRDMNQTQCITDFLDGCCRNQKIRRQYAVNTFDHQRHHGKHPCCQRNGTNIPDYLTVKNRIEQPHKADKRQDNPKPPDTVAE